MTIGDWMETPQGLKVVGYAFGFGAAIVIVGALFKIQHWPGASIMLTAGMGTEGVLFALTALANPHKTYHWEHVFPALTGEEDTEIGAEDGLDGDSKGNAMGSLDASSLSEEDMQKLSQGISKLSQTASQISDLSALTNATSSLVNNMSAASDSVEEFTNSQSQINASSESMIGTYQNIANGLGTAQQSAEEFLSTMGDVNKNLTAINSIYEIQLKAVEDQSESIKSVSNELNKVNSSVASSLQDVETFKEQAAVMAQQVTSLNTVYGNMLNALSM